MCHLEKDQYENVRRAIQEISLGNLGYRLRYSEEHEYYDTLATYINLIGEIRKDYIVELASYHKRMAAKVFLEFYLTEDFRIQKVNGDTTKILEKETNDILGLPFEKLLTKETRKNWKHIQRDYRHYEAFSFGTHLYFKINTWLRFTCYCYISKSSEGTIRISTFEKRPDYSIADLIKEFNIKPPLGHAPLDDFGIKTENEEKRIQKIAAFLEEHLDESLPDTRALAHRFGYNEKNLTKSFKRVYHKTPHTYSVEKRLQKAMQLLKNTNQRIPDIADNIGYNSTSGFYNAFKKRFGLTPGMVRKKV